MKNIRNILNEVKGEKAHKQAVAMGLKYKGFGYWIDPSSGQVTHKTENDQLVSVEPDVESELAGKGEGEEAGGVPPSGGMGNPEGVGGSFGTFQNKQLPTGTGVNVQGIADGPAQAPNNDEGRWEPGPDGDNFVNDQTLKDVNKPPVDSFVGKTNYHGWVAGPDGTNYTNLTMADMLKSALNVNDKSAPVYEEEDKPMGHRTMFRKMLGFEGSAPDDPSHVANARQVYKQQGDTGKGEMMRNVMARGNDTQNMAIQMDRLPDKMARRDEKKGRVKQLNASIKDMVMDKNYDMSQRGEELGSGMFGQVYESKDGKNVIKEGKISPKELAVLHKLAEVKAFPNLINAEVTSPFESADDIYGSGSDSENEEMNDATNAEGMRFFNSQPFADGKIAMSKLSGRPYRDAEGEMNEEAKEKFIQKLHNARGAMHQLGISHNDMHGDNFFIDDEGNPGILDLGLANDDPLSALMEAIGGVTGKDYQLDSDAKMGGGPLASLMGGGFNFVPQALKAKMEGNMGKLKERLQEKMMDYIGDPEDWKEGEDPDEAIENKIGQVMMGGLRLPQGRLDDLREQMPFLEDNEQVLDLIKGLYDNVQDTETGQRMSNAFDNLKKDRATVARANILRAQKGKQPIEDRLAKVLEPDD